MMKSAATALAFALGVAAGCDPATAGGPSGATPDAGRGAVDSGEPPWRAALRALEGATALYSYSFDAAPPAGAHLTLAVHAAQRSQACGRYDGSTKDDDFWILALAVNQSGAGSFAVTTDRLSSHSEHAATLTLLHRRDGAYVERYPALSGTVRIDEEPSIADLRAGAVARASIDVSFAAHAVQALECRGGGAVDAALSPTTCTCSDENGTQTSCTLAPGEEQCCFVTSAAGLPLHLELTASPCAAMCREAAGLPDYCADLRKP